MARMRCTATSSAASNSPNMTDVRTLDTTRLTPWLHAHVPDADGEISAEKFAGGQSNPTYLLSVDGEPRFVLRRKPDGVLLPSAHAI